MNITDRKTINKEMKVFHQGPLDEIFNLVKQIPDEKSELEDQPYDYSKNGNTKYQRHNRELPKDIDFKPGNILTLRLPANYRGEESIKMENRLHNYFRGDIKI